MTLCSATKEHITRILIDPTNLLGLDSTLNNLKGIFIQTGGPGPDSDWQPVSFAGVYNYLTYARPSYDQVIGKLAFIINHISGVSADSSVDGPGKLWFEWATNVIDTAISSAQQRITAGLSPRYHRADFP